MIPSASRPPAPAPSPAPPPTGAARSDLLARTTRLCLVLGLTGFGLTQYLARHAHPGAATRMAQAAGPDAADPETTGSIGTAAAKVTLDPCTSAGLRR